MATTAARGKRGTLWEARLREKKKSYAWDTVRKEDEKCKWEKWEVCVRGYWKENKKGREKSLFIILGQILSEEV